LGEIAAASPFPDSRPAVSISHRISTPLQGLFDPSGSKRSIPPPIERLTLRNRPIALRSPPPLLFLVSAADQRSRLASLPLGLPDRRSHPPACAGDGPPNLNQFLHPPTSPADESLASPASAILQLAPADGSSASSTACTLRLAPGGESSGPPAYSVLRLAPADVSSCFPGACTFLPGQR